MKYEKIGKYCIGALIVIALILSMYSSLKLIGWEPVCIARQCNNWAVGEEWISENCRPNEVNGETVLTCDIAINGQLYNIPLSDIKERVDISDLKSCKKDGMICIKEVYIKEVK